MFVDRTGSAEDFASYIGELEEIVAPYDAESLVTSETHQYDVEANWKVIVENYQECYHCSMIHPELCRVSPPTSGENIERDGNWVGGWMELRQGAETMSLDGRSGGVAMARLDEHELSTVMYVAVLPNLLISLHPDYVMTHLLVPISPRAHAHHLLVGVPGRRSPPARASARRTPWTSGTSPTARTGRPASRSSAAWPLPTTRPARSPPTRTASTTSSPASPAPTRAPA